MPARLVGVLPEERPAAAVDRVEITGSLDPHALEALRLEMLRLASRYGVAVQAFRVERVEAADARRKKRKRSA